MTLYASGCTNASTKFIGHSEFFLFCGKHWVSIYIIYSCVHCLISLSALVLNLDLGSDL